MYPGHHASFPRRSQPLSATGSQASAMPLGMVHVPSLPQPLSRQPPLRGGGLFIKGNGAAMSNAVKTRQREISAQHPPNSKRHSQPKRAPRHRRRSSTQPDIRTHARRRPCTHPNPGAQPPKRAPAAKPPQQHQAGQTHQRETKATHPAQAQAAQPTPNAHRRQSRRSNARQDIRTHAKLRAPASASGRITPPNARPGAPTTRTRQRRAAQAAQTAVGDAKVRILLRDDHAESFRQRKVTSHQAKSAFLWGYPRFFWQDKRNGVQKTKQGAYSGVLLFYFFSCIVFRSSPQACGCSRSRRSCRGK